ncbi:hypothetical protein [Roseateles sp. BYS78W]|uniref:hypothetical protein n=1 Tax=Pelomonas candidula TaxID=3299025 RepID=UPI003749F23A
MKARLAGFGAARFVVADGQGDVVVEWGIDGMATRCEAPPSGCPVFTATAVHWVQFVSGDFTAAAGVLSGKIHFQGSIRTLLPYTLAFNELAKVARPFV